MIQMEMVQALKPGTVLYRPLKQGGIWKIYPTPPITKITPKMVMFKEATSELGRTLRLRQEYVADNYYLSEKGAFLGAIAIIRGAITHHDRKLTKLIGELEPAVAAAKKKGWL